MKQRICFITLALNYKNLLKYLHLILLLFFHIERCLSQYVRQFEWLQAYMRPLLREPCLALVSLAERLGALVCS